jgi:tRNA(Arg) A34 adenosine deaminase TadA
MDALDQQFLREAFRIAREARERGDQPFGALLVGAEREVLFEAHDTVITGRDALAHADMNLLRKAGPVLSPDVLRRCTLYTSAEPCAMCAGAIFWTRIGRVVFGLSTAKLNDLLGTAAEHPRLSIPSRGILALGRPFVEVTGPLFQAEALEAHADYWT